MDTTSHYSEQDRERSEEELANGPVSRGASNQSAPSNQRANTDPTSAAASSGNNDEQYNKLVNRDASDAEGQAGASTNRDLGSVGGGSIPGGNSYDGMNTSNGSSSSSGSSVSQGASADRGDKNVPGMSESPGHFNAADQPQQGTLGGRNPGQSQNQPIGDQDTTFGHRDSKGDEIGDPMTSRAPDKVNQPKKQED